MQGGENRLGDLSFKRNNLSCIDIQSQVINSSKHRHQDSKSKGSNHSGMQIINLENICRFN